MPPHHRPFRAGVITDVVIIPASRNRIATIRL